MVSRWLGSHHGGRATGTERWYSKLGLGYGLAKVRYGLGRKEISRNARRLFCWERNDGLVEISSTLAFSLCFSEPGGDSGIQHLEVTCEAHLEP
jgi:hypothetical protein